MSEKAVGVGEVRDPGLRAGGGRKVRPKAGTEFRGVCWRPGGKLVSKQLGTFDTAEDAARAFDAAAAKIRGAAGRTNLELSGGQDAVTHFHGVRRLSGGKFGARIRGSKEKSQTWLGTLGTADDAARVFDAATVKIHGPAARTNFKHPAATDDGDVSPLLQVPAEPSGGQGPGTKFRGVWRTRSGKFGARIRRYKGKAQTWLGTFDTAEDAAMAYDAAAVELHGASAITNFKQPAAIDDDGVSPLVAEPSGHGVHRQPSGVHRHRKGKAALSPGGFGSPGMWHVDLPVDLPPAEWQQLDDLLKDIDSTEEREALMEGAAVLQHISLADMGIMRQNWALLQ